MGEREPREKLFRATKQLRNPRVIAISGSYFNALEGQKAKPIQNENKFPTQTLLWPKT